jgi:hypothetical protein
VGVIATEISSEELANARCVYDDVIVKLPFMWDEVRVAGAYVDTKFNPSRFVPRYGIVHSLPHVLTNSSFTWTPNMEVEIGDTVWFGAMPSVLATGTEEGGDSNAKCLVCNGELYLCVDYHHLIIAKRGESMFALNGLLITKPVEPDRTHITTEEEQDDVFQVVYSGKNNVSYIYGNEISQFDIVAGTRIITEKYCNIPIEFEVGATLEKMYYCHRHEVRAIC